MIRRLLLALLLVGCATTASYPRSRAWVSVRNAHWLEQVVYVNCGGAKVRIGEARSLTTTLLKLPSWCVDLGRGVTFELDPIGSRERSASDWIGVGAGETLILDIPPVTNGYVFVRR